jgi:hypothetical protein
MFCTETQIAREASQLNARELRFAGRNSGEFRYPVGLQQVVSATQEIHNAGGVRRLVRRISS